MYAPYSVPTEYSIKQDQKNIHRIGNDAYVKISVFVKSDEQISNLYRNELKIKMSKLLVSDLYNSLKDGCKENKISKNIQLMNYKLPLIYA